MRILRRVAAGAALLTLSNTVFADIDLDRINLPTGFSIEVYAEVPDARSLAAGEGGVVYVSNRKGRSVYAILPGPKGSSVVELASGLSTPNGIAYFEGDLYVAEINRVLRFKGIAERLHNPPKPEVLPIELPDKRHHGWRYISFGPDGKLYVSIGAPCNVCEEEGFASIERMNVDGSGRETVARGVRNSVGFDWHPDTGELWFTDNGRDRLGDDIPPCELNRVTQPGQHFGFPYCHGGDIEDPDFSDGQSCAKYEPPVQRLGPHVAPLGLEFYTGHAFPDRFQKRVFIAEHGSWNRSSKIGYRVTMVTLDAGRATRYETFADGWLDGQKTLGRPVDLLVMQDGSMLVSDDMNGLVYRISYETP